LPFVIAADVPASDFEIQTFIEILIFLVPTMWRK